ncbi:nuclear fusion protein KAR5 [Podospora australis]|uniref:Nuclear fusion protein KAR5 n=1 Tax=Podospora australis TaxID=1536484 RepID=A0AAN6WYX7_9PEZI|nr:nuclear fusion protein KAR5 [Podospora australis]
MHRSFGVILALTPCIVAFGWRGDRRSVVPAVNINSKPSDVLPKPPRTIDIYATALHELQEMESEPYCHRVAARLLVNNCQLVDGKDEATIMTDSGRQVRDFVDSYAASLAICDLERGSFTIPKECAKFREPSLSQIAMRNEPQLHVSPKEIGLCLSSLAASDAAWNTWVSYRHKALRFCEAARADNEKDQNILLYQRLTQVIAKLTDGVDLELQRRMDDLDNRARQSVESIERLAPKINQLQEGLEKLESFLAGDLDFAVRKSTESLHEGLDSAEALRTLLSTLLQNAVDGNSRLTHAHGASLAQASKKVNNEIGSIIEVVSTALASSASLQQQVQLSNQQAAALSQRQEALEKGMDKILEATETLSTKFEDHSAMLKQASNITSEILDVLEDTAAAASSVNDSLLSATTQSLWPFIICPTASLVLGSYGLPPSMVRNFGLLAFGEALGFIISTYGTLTTEFFNSNSTPGITTDITSESERPLLI